MIDYQELESKIESMGYKSKLYSVLKSALTKRGNWKQKARGGSFKTAEDKRRNTKLD